MSAVWTSLHSDTYESLNLALFCYEACKEGEVSMKCHGISVKKNLAYGSKFSLFLEESAWGRRVVFFINTFSAFFMHSKWAALK